MKSITGGLLAQTPDEAASRLGADAGENRAQPTAEEMEALQFGWKL